MPPLRQARAPGTYPPAAYAHIRSALRGQACDVVFSNETDVILHTKWIDWNGLLKDYREVRPGFKYRQPTYKTHSWLVTNSEGEVFAFYMGASAVVAIQGRGMFTVAEGEVAAAGMPGFLRPHAMQPNAAQRATRPAIRDLLANTQPAQRLAAPPANLGKGRAPVFWWPFTCTLLSRCVKPLPSPTNKSSKGSLGATSKRSVEHGKCAGAAGVPACSLCFDALSDGESSVWALACGHVYHAPCLNSAFEQLTELACPICRADVRTDGVRRIYLDACLT